MPTVGSLAYSIVAKTSDFTKGIVATKSELRTLKDAFLASQKPVQAYSAAISHLETLMAKFPEKADTMRHSIAAMNAEMRKTFAGSFDTMRGGFLPLGTAARAESGLGMASRISELPSFDRGGGGLLQITTAARAQSALGDAAGRSAGAIRGLAGILTQVTGGFGHLSGVMKAFAGSGGALGLAALGVGGLVFKLAQLGDAARDARNERAGLLTSKDIEEQLSRQAGTFSEDTGLSTNPLKRSFSSILEWVNVQTGADQRSHLADVIADEMANQRRVTAEGYMRMIEEMERDPSAFFEGRDIEELKKRNLPESMTEAIDKAEKALRLRNIEEDKAAIEIERDLRITAQIIEKERLEELKENGRKAQEMMDRVNQEIAEKGEQLAESLKRPAEKMRDEFTELLDARRLGSITDAQFLRGVEDLRSRARDIAAPDTGIRTVTGLRAGTVEALRASTGGAVAEKQLEQQKIQTEEQKTANDLLTEIKTAIAANPIKEAL